MVVEHSTELNSEKIEMPMDIIEHTTLSCNFSTVVYCEIIRNSFIQFDYHERNITNVVIIVSNVKSRLYSGTCCISILICYVNYSSKVEL